MLSLDFFEENEEKLQAIEVLLRFYDIKMEFISSVGFRKPEGFVVSWKGENREFPQVRYLRDDYSSRLDTAIVYTDLLVAVCAAVSDKCNHEGINDRSDCTYKVLVLKGD